MSAIRDAACCSQHLKLENVHMVSSGSAMSSGHVDACPHNPLPDKRRNRSFGTCGELVQAAVSSRCLGRSSPAAVCRRDRFPNLSAARPSYTLATSLTLMGLSLRYAMIMGEPTSRRFGGMCQF